MAAISRQFDLPQAEIEGWVEDGKRGMENALRAKPEDVREQYERQLNDLQGAYGEAMLESGDSEIYAISGGGHHASHILSYFLPRPGFSTGLSKITASQELGLLPSANFSRPRLKIGRAR
ncbi:hypothetical protein OHC51_03600 [Stenotrophomonas indicatrix]|uniref:hypothetical protein n=1 Tax=Stenotrophomonas indicatrix TaxID=2045451 RepID=UPI0031C51A6E